MDTRKIMIIVAIIILAGSIFIGGILIGVSVAQNDNDNDNENSNHNQNDDYFVNDDYYIQSQLTEIAINQLEFVGVVVNQGTRDFILDEIYFSEQLPVHVPGSIDLWNPEELAAAFYLPYVPVHRATFYTIPGDFEIRFGRVPDEWILHDNPVAPPTMMLMRFILYHEIPFYQFVEEIERLREVHERLGRSTNLELDELPNPEIIYTFDPEIISYFYRRE